MARDIGRETTIEPEVTPAAVAPVVMEIEDPEVLGEILSASNDTVNIDDIDLDDITVEVTDEQGNPISNRSKRSIGPVGAIVVKLLLKGKIIAHYVFKIVSGFKHGVLSGLIG